jgi:hypothetical protein
MNPWGVSPQFDLHQVIYQEAERRWGVHLGGSASQEILQQEQRWHAELRARKITHQYKEAIIKHLDFSVILDF